MSERRAKPSQLSFQSLGNSALVSLSSVYTKDGVTITETTQGPGGVGAAEIFTTPANQIHTAQYLFNSPARPPVEPIAPNVKYEIQPGENAPNNPISEAVRAFAVELVGAYKAALAGEAVEDKLQRLSDKVSK